MPFRILSRGFALAVILLPLLTGCVARVLNKKTARDAIYRLTPGMFSPDEVYITDVNQTGERDAIAQASVKAAFKLEKVQGTWVVREVRLGERPWERIEDILAALDLVKTEQTRKLLEAVSAAIAKYREKNGAVPAFNDYISLTDALNPNYLTPLVREDAWHRPLAAFKVASDAIRLLSAGPDGRMGTPDDIEMIRSFR